MVSTEHEVPLELIRDSPALVTRFLTELGVEPPKHTSLQVDHSGVNETKVTEHHSDSVVLLLDGSKVVMAVIVEVQLRFEKDKIYDWFPYVANLWARRRCPTTLIVYAPERKTARRCAAPITIGHPGLTLTPLVMGPDAVPVITDTHVARETPELTLLSGAIHGNDNPDVLKAVVHALNAIEPSKTVLYVEFVAKRLSEAAKRELETLMTMIKPERHSIVAVTNYAAGQADGQATGRGDTLREVLFDLAEARGLTLTDESRSQITACTDLDKLGTWVKRAMVAERPEDIFR
ncbi:hypothetical protein HerbRD11066_33210 [Herbidospora sp. RD11066]